MARRITEVTTGGRNVRELGTTYSNAEIRRMAARPGARVPGSVLRRTGEGRAARQLGVSREQLRGAIKGGAEITSLARRGGRAAGGRKG